MQSLDFQRAHDAWKTREPDEKWYCEACGCVIDEDDGEMEQESFVCHECLERT